METINDLKSDEQIKKEIGVHGRSSHVGFYNKLNYSLVKFETYFINKQGNKQYKDNSDITNRLKRDGYLFCAYNGDYTYYIKLDSDVYEYMRNYMCEGQIGAVTTKTQPDNEIALYCSDVLSIASYRLVTLNKDVFYSSAKGVK